jgi:GT2 family glycosyltransferase
VTTAERGAKPLGGRTVNAGERVRVVIVNYNGGQLTLRCLESLADLDWPKDRLEVVVVDNASTDGSLESVRASFPTVATVQAGGNVGYAAANNLALQDLSGVDFVALLNNDAVVDRDWLAPLVRALKANPQAGAACPKILFVGSFVELALETPAFVPGRGDWRKLGVRVSGVGVDGEERLADTHFLESYGWEEGSANESLFQWTTPRARLRVPAGAGTAALRVAAEREKPLTVFSHFSRQRFVVGPDPSWIHVRVEGPAVDVINNVGCTPVAGAHGGDRGFLEVDSGQYDKPVDVFAWSGCSVLLPRRYLEDVGLFDPRFFLYYEDFDLSWRGRERGWRYIYVPESRVRHIRAATTVAGSPLLQHYVERNRLLVHAKNAPARQAGYAVLRYVGGTAKYAMRDIGSPLLHGEAPRPARVRRRLRALLAFAKHLPTVIRERRRRPPGSKPKSELDRETIATPERRAPLH